MAWEEMARYRSGAPDGSIEEFVLEKDADGNFRLRNDFGNTIFEFERMSGYELFRKVKRDIQDDIEKDLNDLWADIDINDLDTDSDSVNHSTDPFDKYNLDSDSFGAD